VASERAKCMITPLITGATGIVTKRLKKHLKAIAGKQSTNSLLKTAIIGRGEFRRTQTRQLPRAVDLKGRLLSCQSY